ncbi:hypothetical protein ACFZCL_40215 [Streptomyces sp. NPDC008159]|uniref:hypothetical protein n=1 Tax=Streptomyces sp. NPDC008159 TaxID=3364817 RepID=UPI0036EA6093
MIVETGASTMTSLARATAISLFTVSHHTSALRNAGLIVTERTGASVSHIPTLLGTALLRGSQR